MILLPIFGFLGRVFIKCIKKMFVRINANQGPFFSILVFFHENSRITGLQGEGEGISLTPHHHFNPLHRD